MKGWFLFREAVVLLWLRRSAAVRIVFPVALAMFVAEFVIGHALRVTFPLVAGVQGFDIGNMLPLMAFDWKVALIWGVAAFLVWTAGLSLVAVNWHRHNLLSEPVGWRPAFQIDRVYSHALALIAVTVVSGLLLAVVFWLMSAVGVPRLGWVGLAIMLAVLFGLLSQLLRFALIMPAAAVGRELDLDAVLPVTDDAGGAMLVLSGLYGLCVLAIGFVLGLPATIFSGAWTAAFDLVATWVGYALLLSVLTTLYRHYIADRASA